MPTPNETKALGFLVLLTVSGSAVRMWQARQPLPPAVSVSELERQLERVDSARRAPGSPGGRARTPAARATRPAARPPEFPIDLDRASAAEIDALPGIGPALASRIVKHRDSVGPFGSLDAVCEVRGIGPATAARMRPLVSFSGPRRPVSAGCDDGSKSRRTNRGQRGREPR